MSGFLVEIANVFWIHFMERNRMYLSATAGAFTTLIRMFGLLEIVKDSPYTLIFALIAGEWIGNVIGIHIKKGFLNKEVQS